MASRVVAALAVSIAFSGGSVAFAAQAVQPRAGVLLTGTIQFPREQGMSLATDPRNGSKLTAYLGFDGRCRGGGLSEVWAANIPARPVVRVRDGRFTASLTGTTRNLGGVQGRTGVFRWRVSGRFLEPDVATVTVSGEADVRMRGHVISRCKIADPASARVAVRAR